LGQIIRIPANNWQPRPHQAKLWYALEAGYKRLIEIAHRRWGKDEIALNFAATSAMQDPATMWHMLPEYAQARKAIWNAVNPHTGKRRIDEAFPLEIRESTNEHEMFIRFITGATWQVVGSDNYKSLVGAPPKVLIFSEWAKADPAAWAYLSPILEENGGVALFITTPEGKNHAHSMYQLAKRTDEWFADLQTVEDTGFPLERVEKARLEYHALFGEEAGDALIEQEYFCSFTAAILGAVYGKQMAKVAKEKRVTDRVEHDPNYPVYTTHDMGFDDAHAIVFFQVGAGELLIIDYDEGSGWEPRNICERLYGRKIIVNERNNDTGEIADWHFGEDIEGIEHRKEYTYAMGHHVPWDAGVKVQAAGGRSTVEQCRRLGIKMFVHPGASQADDEAALRSVLPRCWFSTKAQKLVDALEAYHRKWDEDKKKFKDKPEHDWSSHGCDASELMAKVYRDKVVTTKEVEHKRVVQKFERLRRENSLTPTDPYRLRSKKKRRDS
jgi:phage terminase large subunit